MAMSMIDGVPITGQIESVWCRQNCENGTGYAGQYNEPLALCTRI